MFIRLISFFLIYFNCSGSSKISFRWLLVMIFVIVEYPLFGSSPFFFSIFSFQFKPFILPFLLQRFHLNRCFIGDQKHQWCVQSTRRLDYYLFVDIVAIVIASTTDVNNIPANEWNGNVDSGMIGHCTIYHISLIFLALCRFHSFLLFRVFFLAFR